MRGVRRALELDQGAVTALLGPTNTGKTHRAVERMLAHDSGMIGFPLRLLAREVYDRLSERLGEEALALVTGEEKRIPASARYWICTVESMPVDRPVSFLAVDEIQLASHPERGHIFTQRLLHDRGGRETMFMGSDTIAPLLRQLVPEVRIERAERLSTLRYSGRRNLARLKRRSVVVAFSAARVYELAERLKQRRGGAAVVMGALSPRARNAQVAMYQSGEVHYLVATDAVGMGLNMDVEHVAFADLRKYDGRRHRDLTPMEVGQIAGRAGRFRRDGTFGTTDRADGIDEAVVEAVEGHSFAPLTWLWWRNHELDLSDLDALRESLCAPPPSPWLRRKGSATDHRVLELLASQKELRRQVVREDDVALLWEVCQIPDYRQGQEDHHRRLLSGLYIALQSGGGRLASGYVGRQLGRLDRDDGDIHTLMGRMAAIRTWSYIAHRADWVPDAQESRGRAAEIEERLSEALHQRLTERFVDRPRAGVLAPSGVPIQLGEGGRVVVSGAEVGRLVGFSLEAAETLEGALARRLRSLAQEALGAQLEAALQRVENAADDEFRIDEEGRVELAGAPCAELVRGASPARPGLRLLADHLLRPGQARRAERRLRAWLAGWLSRLLGPLQRLPEDSPGPVKGLAYELVEGLGLIRRRAQVDKLTRRERKLLARLDVRLGRRWLFVHTLLKPAQLAQRAQLASVWFRIPPDAPPPGRVALPLERSRAPGWYRLTGFVPIGDRAIRVDVAERIAAQLRDRARSAPAVGFVAPPQMPSWLGLGWDAIPAVVVGFGYPLATAVGLPPSEFRYRRKPRR